MTEQQAIERWKELGVQRCEMEFSCGGDSMNDYNFKLFDKEGQEIEDAELNAYFGEAIWKKVEFYENSDGHYLGESGTVEIRLQDEDEEPYFSYDKNARSEWNETIVTTIGIKLTPEMVEYIEKNVSNINGSRDDFAINYKRDFILSDADVAVEEAIETLITKTAEEFEPELPSNEDSLEEWFTFNTDTNEEESRSLTIKDGELQVRISNQYMTFSDSED
jgi:hypothetical protein